MLKLVDPEQHSTSRRRREALHDSLQVILRDPASLRNNVQGSKHTPLPLRGVVAGPRAHHGTRASDADRDASPLCISLRAARFVRQRVLTREFLANVAVHAGQALQVFRKEWAPTLKKEATKPAAPNVLQQQARFDTFVEQYNRDRPHQALEMKVPADCYVRSSRVYRGLDELTYPFHDATFTVTQCGRICFKGRKVNLSHVFAGQNVGVTQVGERVWLVTFMRYDLGYFDDETCRLEPIENPFDPKVLRMCSE
jgi:hypothetical protein